LEKTDDQKAKPRGRRAPSVRFDPLAGRRRDYAVASAAARAIEDDRFPPRLRCARRWEKFEPTPLSKAASPAKADKRARR
jgi:hypothetical protein